MLRVSLGLKTTFALFAFSALMATGASARDLSNEQQADLVSRATARWKAIEARDWATVYTFSSPAYRQVISQNLYVHKYSYMVEWELTSVEFLNYDAAAAVASVAVRVMSKPTKPTSAASKAIGSVPSRVVENWVLVDDEWWYSASL